MTSSRRWTLLLTILVAWLALALAGPLARAQGAPASARAPAATAVRARYGIDDLARRVIDLGAALGADAVLPNGALALASLKDGAGTTVACEPAAMQLAGGRVAPTGGIQVGGALAGHCDGFWFQPGPKLGAFTLTFTRAAGGPDLTIALTGAGAISEVGAPLTRGAPTGDNPTGNVIARSGYAGGDEVYSFSPDLGWNGVEVGKGGALTLAGEYTRKKDPSFTRITLASRMPGGMWRIRDSQILTAKAPAAARPSLAPSGALALGPGEALAPGTPSATPALDADFVRCTPPAGFGDPFVVCADQIPDADDQGLVTITHLPEGHALRPNRSILVMVRHSDRVGVAVAAGGTRGVYLPPIDNQAGPNRAEAEAPAAGPLPRPRTSVVSLHTFAPRLPGRVDVKISVLRPGADGAAPATLGDTTVELTVDATYGGAFRMGFGLVMGGAVDRSYAARKSPLTGAEQIVAVSSGKVDLELVLGFAPFFDIFRGGRSYADTWSLTHFPFGISPYVGAGVLTVGSSGVDGFKSLYLGGEWEPSPYFSVAFAWVGRRVTRLAPGAVLGGPTVDGGAPTTTTFASGVGLVFNVSPDLFRLAASKPPSFFR